MARSHELRRVVAAARDLHEELGTLSTFEQIAEGSHYVSMIRNTREDDFKDQVWRRYVKEYCNHGWVWNQITLYRHTGQSSHFFAPDEDLDYLTLDELTCAWELWVSLIVAGKLQRLLQNQEYNGVKTLQESGASPAEVFRAYINVHKSRASIDKWTKRSMSDMRFTIYEAVLEVRHEGDRSRDTASIGRVVKQEALQPGPSFSNNTHIHNDYNELYGASPRPATRLNAIPSSSHSISVQSASQTISSTSQPPAVVEPGHRQASSISGPQATSGPSSFQGFFTKIRKFEIDLKTVEVQLREKQMAVREVEEAVEQAKTRFRNVGREARLADLDQSESEDWTPAELLRQADEIEKVAKLKREALHAISDLLEKKRSSKAELTEVETEERKYRGRMQRLMDVVQEFDEN
ncbi:hypothetical protein N431DRAFT_454439 [Stipitochalara longipes BDJ]|nr:hypothetical protein N431DRAFT_454439 [Stipitochalara longipes BDJ]